MNKVHFSIGVLVGLISTSVFADDAPVLNIIKYQQTVKQWVKTDSAKVTVNVDASMKNEAAAEVQKQILKKLSSISANESWRIDDFHMAQDDSGLQRLSWQLSARLPWNVVNSLQAKMTKLSVAGQQFKIQNINFAPSLLSKQKALASLRNEVYSQVNGELKRLNKNFSPTHYFLHKITFSTGQPVIMSNVKMMQAKSASDNQASPGREVNLMANIELASELK